MLKKYYMKKFFLISTLLALCFSASAQMKASFAGGFDLGASVIKSSEFFHFVQAGGQVGVDLESNNGDILFLGAGLNLGICGDKFLSIGDGEKMVFCPLYVDATYDFNNIGSMIGGLYGELRGGFAFGGITSIKGSKVNSGYFAFGGGYQVGGMSVGLEFSLYPGMKSTIDGYTVTRDSAGSNLAIKFKYRFGKSR